MEWWSGRAWARRYRRLSDRTSKGGLDEVVGDEPPITRVAPVSPDGVIKQMRVRLMPTLQRAQAEPARLGRCRRRTVGHDSARAGASMGVTERVRGTKSWVTVFTTRIYLSMGQRILGAWS